MKSLYRITPTLFHDEMVSTLGVADRPYGLEMCLIKETAHPALVAPNWFKLYEHVADETHTHILMSTEPCYGEDIPADLRLMYTIINDINNKTRILYYGPSNSAYREGVCTGLTILVLQQLKYDLSDSFNDANNERAAFVKSFINKNMMMLEVLQPIVFHDIHSLIHNREEFYNAASNIWTEEEMHTWLGAMFLKNPLRYNLGLAYNTLNNTKTYSDVSTYLVCHDYKFVGSPGRVLSVGGVDNTNAYNPHLSTNTNNRGLIFNTLVYNLIEVINQSNFYEFSLTFLPAGMVRMNFVGNHPNEGCDISTMHNINDAVASLSYLGMELVQLREIVINMFEVGDSIVNHDMDITVCKTFNESLVIHSKPSDNVLVQSGGNRAYYFDIPLTMVYAPNKVCQLPDSLAFITSI